MASEDRHITRINDTEANIRANLDAAQIAQITDITNDLLVMKDHGDTNLFYYAPQYYWTGAAQVFCDVEFNDVEANGDFLAAEYIKRSAGTDDYIRFQDDSITIAAGNVTAATFQDDNVEIPLYLGVGVTHSDNYQVNSKYTLSTASGTTTSGAVLGQLDIAVTGNATSFAFGGLFTCTDYEISSGVTDSGYKIGVRAEGFLANASTQGTLTDNYGCHGRAGISTCGAGSTITNAYGLYAEVLNTDADGTITNAYGVYIDNSETTGTITNRYDLYCSSTNAANYFAGNIEYVANIIGKGVSSNIIRMDTSDGSDNKSLIVSGGGGVGDTRGAYINMQGNEAASTGKLLLYAGNVSGGDILFFTGGTTAVTIDENQDMTIAGSITGSDTDLRIQLNTSDGSDTKSLLLGGGGSATSVDRGSCIFLYGNESGSGGDLKLYAGNVAGGEIELYTGNAVKAMNIDENQITYFYNKVAFTQTDGNEYIDSLADGYMDYGSTSGHRFDAPITMTYSQAAVTDLLLKNTNASGGVQLELEGDTGGSQTTYLLLDNVNDMTELGFAEGELRLRDRGSTPYLKITCPGGGDDYKIHTAGGTPGNIILGADSTDVLTITDAEVYTTGWTDYSGSSTITGWSGTPTAIIDYMKIGKLVFVKFDITGTSNSTAAQFTLPDSITNTGTKQMGFATAVDNSSDIGGATVYMGFNSANLVEIEANLSYALSGGTWTASGTKSVNGMLWYYMAD